MKLIVGLGNPGKKYDGTRHNIGFAVIDSFIEKFVADKSSRSKFEAEIIEFDFVNLPDSDLNCEQSKLSDLRLSGKNQGENKKKSTAFEIAKEKIIIAKPQTYMNLSGTAVQKLMQFYKLKRQDILIVHDDVALDFGRLRLSYDRGAGGQHGVEDIIEKIGGKDFYRLRIGVGPDPGGDERADFVLSKFAKSDSSKKALVIEKSINVVSDWVVYYGSDANTPQNKLERIIQDINTFNVV